MTIPTTSTASKSESNSGGPPAASKPVANPFADQPQTPNYGSQQQYAPYGQAQPQHGYGQMQGGAQPGYGYQAGYGAYGHSSDVWSDKSKMAAGLLGIFVGGWGVHRFYLGFIGIGLLQIFVTLITCGIGGLWGFIEGILYLTGSMDRDVDGRKLRD